MHSTDVRILSELQKDSKRSIAELSERVGLSSSACHRRIHALEDSGVIAGYAAQLAPDKMDIGLQARIDITLDNQSRACMQQFEEAVMRYEEILECDLVSGEADYRLRVAAPDLAGFDDIHRRCLAELPGVSAMHTSFVLRSIKQWHGYSLKHLY